LKYAGPVKRDVERMKDYLNATEKNQLMVLMSVLQLMNGERNGGIDGPKISAMLEDWDKRGNMTKEEHKNLKMANTYLSKFCTSVMNRLAPEEKEKLHKRLIKFDFRLVDDYTLKKIYRDINNHMVNAVIPRDMFYKWCEEIMDVNCNGCNENWKKCELHKVLEENFVPESTWNKNNCRYAYKGNRIAEKGA
jgi:hypothetical protein